MTDATNCRDDSSSAVAHFLDHFHDDESSRGIETRGGLSEKELGKGVSEEVQQMTNDAPRPRTQWPAGGQIKRVHVMRTFGKTRGTRKRERKQVYTSESNSIAIETRFFSPPETPLTKLSPTNVLAA